jgi:hypothetical protein
MNFYEMVDRIAYITSTKFNVDNPWIQTQFGTEHYTHQRLGLLGYDGFTQSLVSALIEICRYHER